MGLLLLLVIIATLGNFVQSCKSISRPPASKSPPSYDLTEKELRLLYNTRVVSMQAHKRALQGWTKPRSVFYHAGVVATLPNGETWLIHKVCSKELRNIHSII